jgi:hypothetical protein
MEQLLMIADIVEDEANPFDEGAPAGSQYLITGVFLEVSLSLSSLFSLLSSLFSLLSSLFSLLSSPFSLPPFLPACLRLSDSL